MSLSKFHQNHGKLQQEANNQQNSQKPKVLSPKKFAQNPYIKNGANFKSDPSIKPPKTRPQTAKHQQSQNNYKYFQSKPGNQAKYISPKKKMQIPKTPNQYQSRSKSKTPIKVHDQIIRQQINVQPQHFKVQQRGIRTFSNDNPSLPKVMNPIFKFQPAKYSKTFHGSIKAYAASTNQGPVRQYNEDRVAIILNFTKPQNAVDWIKPYYFGIFDGHGGIDCADMLRDNLHLIIAKQKNFPHMMMQAIKTGFQKYQKSFSQQSLSGKTDRSGSCAIIVFILGKQCYIGNLGDSRAIMSVSRGKYIRQLSLDHKASDQFQMMRIIKNGGRIYQTKIRNRNPNLQIIYNGQPHKFVLGPHRVAPGRLSVTRTFGDIQAKMIQFGGNPKAIISEPEITSFTITQQDDFIILACDGIYDKLSSSEVISIVWDTFKRDRGSFQNIHEFCGKAVQNIMKLAFHKKTLDNITVVLIALQGLQKYFNYYLQQNLQQNNPVNELKNPQKRIPKQMNRNNYSFQKRYIGKSLSPSHQIKYNSKYNNNTQQ